MLHSMSSVGGVLAVLVGAAALAACSTAPNADDRIPGADRSSAPSETVTQLELSASTTPFDRRVLGTNLPAWLGSDRLRDPEFQDEAVASGTTMVRMPGGSWSNSYDWFGCEMGDDTSCYFTWAARPSDFIAFMEATGLAGMWTASINDTAQSAAAAVAFFNGAVDDTRPIGTDRHGTDWKTVGHWAQLRVDGGHAAPARIELWEVGNEVFGGKPATGGEQCAGFGWEDVWTCDGTEYVEGTDDHDGFLAFRSAMLAVDPTIQVGAVGVGEPAEWSDWGREVIDGTDGEMDFYVVHDYGFNESPDLDDLLERPSEHWPELMAELRMELDAAIPVAVTEYNLVAFQDGDTDATMTTAANALFLADTLGQLALNGVTTANQWNLANGTADNGTDYGMLDLDTGERRPQFYAMAAWARAGERLHDHIDLGDVRVYPSTHADGRVTLVALNRGDTPASHRWTLGDEVSPPSRGEVVSATAVGPDATTMVSSDAVALDVENGEVDVTLAPWSISTIELSP